MDAPTLLDVALQYAGRGWYVLPLHGMIPAFGGLRCTCGKSGCASPGKHPRSKGGEKDASIDPDQLRKWFARAGNDGSTNIGIATGPSGLCALDADGEAGKLELLEASGGDLPTTLTARTGNGFHLIYARGDERIVSLQRKGAAAGTRASTGYIVAAPSLHASGRRYEWVNDVPLAPVPAWVKGWASRGESKPSPSLIPRAPRPVRHEPSAGAAIGPMGLERLADRALEGLGSETAAYSIEEAQRLASALAAIDADIDGRTWASYGAALHDLEWFTPAPGGMEWVDVGLELWDAWSRGSPAESGERGAYPGRGALERRWASYDQRGDYDGPKVTVASIYQKARSRGWSDGGISAGAVGAVNHNEQGKVNGVNGMAALPPVFTKASANNPLIRLNERYAAIGDVGGKCLIMSWVPSKVERTLLMPSFQTFSSFKDRYANQYVKVKVEKNRAKGVEVVEEAKPLGAYWTAWSGRRSYEGIDLVPGQGPDLPGGYLNLWTGFGVDSAPGDWTLMKRHILEVLAGGNREAAEYIVKFAAWAVQNPDTRSEVALVFRGDKGTGKGTFAKALCDLFGQHGLHIFSPKHMVGNFNGHLRSCILLFCDEAFWAGDKQGESVLKGMLTESTLLIEQKGIDATQWKNRLHVVMNANAEWVVPASKEERRYAVFNVSDVHRGDFGYFAAIQKEKKEGGLAAMLHDLLNLPLGDWHPRDIVYTDAIQQQKAHSLSALGAWWEHLLQDGILPFGAKIDGEKITVPAGDLLESAKAFASHPNQVNTTALGRYLSTAGCTKGRTAACIVWAILDLNLAREAWEAKFGKWTWDSAAKEWEIEKAPARLK